MKPLTEDEINEHERVICAHPGGRATKAALRLSFALRVAYEGTLWRLPDEDTESWEGNLPERDYVITNQTVWVDLTLQCPITGRCVVGSGVWRFDSLSWGGDGSINIFAGWTVIAWRPCPSPYRPPEIK